MLNRLLGTGTTPSMLRKALDDSSARVRATADRVANAATPANGGFPGALKAASGAASGVDLEQQMVNLADERLRYEATSTLLQKIYAQIRASVREG